MARLCCSVHHWQQQQAAIITMLYILLFALTIPSLALAQMATLGPDAGSTQPPWCTLWGEHAIPVIVCGVIFLLAEYILIIVCMCRRHRWKVMKEVHRRTQVPNPSNFAF